MTKHVPGQIAQCCEWGGCWMLHQLRAYELTPPPGELKQLHGPCPAVAIVLQPATIRYKAYKLLHYCT